MQRITISPNQIQDNSIDLDPAQYHYLTRVIRLKNGAKFQAIDGTGKLYLAELNHHTATIVELTIAIISNVSPPIIPICAIPKGNHFDEIVRACTELGAAEIIPALSDRTLLQPSPQKLQRWRKIAQEAAEQSERTTIPPISEPQALQIIFERLPAHSYKYLCQARGEHPHLLNCLQYSGVSDRPIFIAIGPEGGWTDTEISLAIEHGFELVSLGSPILRTITAPIVAVAIALASSTLTSMD